MLYRTLILLSLLVVSGCAPVSTPYSRFHVAYMQHPTEFTTTIDSNAILWSRAESYIRERAAILIETDTLYRAFFAPENDSLRQATSPNVLFAPPDINIFRTLTADSVTIRIDREAWMSQPEGVERHLHPRELAFHMRTGLRQSDFDDVQ